MTKLFVLLPFLFGAIFANASTSVIYEAKAPPSAQERRETILALIQQYEERYEIPQGHLLSLVSCETAGTMSPTIQSKAIQPYGQEESYGLVQVHLPAHPELTYEQVTDPDFALDWAGNNWEERHKLWYVCSRKNNL